MKNAAFLENNFVRINQLENKKSVLEKNLSREDVFKILEIINSIECYFYEVMAKPMAN